MQHDTQFIKAQNAAHSGAFGFNPMKTPTIKMQEAGNYKKGKLRIFGLDIAIENPAGTYRDEGKSWRVADHYGYIKGVVGADGDNLDCFVGGNLSSNRVFVINQKNRDGSFDEHKTMIGYDTPQQAILAYQLSYEQGWHGLHSIVPMSVKQFKFWLDRGNKANPVSSSELPVGGDYELPSALSDLMWTDNEPNHAIDNLLIAMRRMNAHGEMGDLLVDPVDMDDLTQGAEQVVMLDALVSAYGKLKLKMVSLQKAMARKSELADMGAEIQISEPFKRYGSLQVSVLFTLTDGQTVAIFFHNPDTTPNKITPQDSMVSWKWMLNKKDVTIVVAPESGQDISANEVAMRIMKLAEKNAPLFAKAQARKGERVESIKALRDEVKSLESREAELNAEIEKRKGGGSGENEVGEFGQIFKQFYHDAQGAIKHLTKHQDGEAVAALYHPEIGDIDLAWGWEGSPEKDYKNGRGLAKLIKKHPEVLVDLQGFISSLTVDIESSGTNRKVLVNKSKTAIVSLDWYGSQKTWLLTAYDKDASSNSPSIGLTDGDAKVNRLNTTGNSNSTTPLDVVNTAVVSPTGFNFTDMAKQAKQAEVVSLDAFLAGQVVKNDDTSKPYSVIEKDGSRYSLVRFDDNGGLVRAVMTKDKIKEYFANLNGGKNIAEKPSEQPQSGEQALTDIDFIYSVLGKNGWRKSADGGQLELAFTVTGSRSSSISKVVATTGNTGRYLMADSKPISYAITSVYLGKVINAKEAETVIGGFHEAVLEWLNNNDAVIVDGNPTEQQATAEPEPIVVTGKELEESKGSIENPKDRANAVFSYYMDKFVNGMPNGIYSNGLGVWVKFDKTGAKKTKSFSGNPKKAKLVVALDKIIAHGKKTGEEIASEKSSVKKIIKAHFLKHDVMLGDEKLTVRVVIHEKADGTYSYDHDIDRNEAVRVMGGSSGALDSVDSTENSRSVLQHNEPSSWHNPNAYNLPNTLDSVNGSRMVFNLFIEGEEPEYVEDEALELKTVSNSDHGLSLVKKFVDSVFMSDAQARRFIGVAGKASEVKGYTTRAMWIIDNAKMANRSFIIENMASVKTKDQKQHVFYNIEGKGISKLEFDFSKFVISHQDYQEYLNDKHTKNNTVEVTASIKPEPIVLTGKELGDFPNTEEGKKALRLAAKQHLDSINGQWFSCPALHDKVEVRTAGIKKMISMSGDPKKLKMMAVIPKILLNAKKIAPSQPTYLPQKEKSVKAYHYLRSSAKIEDKLVDVNVVIREDDDGKFHYDMTVKGVDESIFAQEKSPSKNGLDSATASNGYRDSLVSYQLDSSLSSTKIYVNMFIVGEEPEYVENEEYSLPDNSIDVTPQATQENKENNNIDAMKYFENPTEMTGEQLADKFFKGEDSIFRKMVLSGFSTAMLNSKISAMLKKDTGYYSTARSFLVEGRVVTIVIGTTTDISKDKNIDAPFYIQVFDSVTNKTSTKIQLSINNEPYQVVEFVAQQARSFANEHQSELSWNFTSYESMSPKAKEAVAYVNDMQSKGYKSGSISLGGAGFGDDVVSELIQDYVKGGMAKKLPFNSGNSAIDYFGANEKQTLQYSVSKVLSPTQKPKTASDWVSIARKTAPTNNIREYLNGVHISPDGKMVSSDGHRMTIINGSPSDFNAVIDAAGGIPKDDVLSYKTKHDDGYTINNDGFFVRGSFPDWERVLPREPKSQGDIYPIDILKLAAHTKSTTKIGSKVWFKLNPINIELGDSIVMVNSRYAKEAAEIFIKAGYKKATAYTGSQNQLVIVSPDKKITHVIMGMKVSHSAFEPINATTATLDSSNEFSEFEDDDLSYGDEDLSPLDQDSFWG